MQNRYQRLFFLLKSYRKLFLLSALLFFGYFTQAQNISDFQKEFQVNIKPTTSPIVLDGILEEAVWKNAVLAKDSIKKYYTTLIFIFKYSVRIN